MKNKLADYRSLHGYSQETLAKQLKVSRQTIISIEKGKYNPSLPLGMMIAEIFKVKVEDIFVLEESDYK
ncbi:helix-turn-helix transcriptional regulator [Macrococcus animalis]|uniref:helix-turn-helix transcriptional regulator n=1 Tax=Macrococcus animalis TaxID=3395467 RepID=UPI0039BE2813